MMTSIITTTKGFKTKQYVSTDIIVAVTVAATTIYKYHLAETTHA